MSDMTITIDGKEIPAAAGQTIMQAADAAGVYIPRLCAHQDLTPHGSCRVCTVMVNGRPQAACTQPVANGMVIENDTEKLLGIRRNIVDMLFVEGNHFCMFCEKSGNCELQAIAYRLGILHPKYPYQFPKKDVDASHPSMYIDRKPVHPLCPLASGRVSNSTASTSTTSRAGAFTSTSRSTPPTAWPRRTPPPATRAARTTARPAR